MGKKTLGLGLVLGAGALLLEPSVAAAAPWDAAVGAVAGTLQGTLGKTIAIIAVIALGLMAMAGKLEWMTAIKVVLGIVIMFSAGQIINWIAPNAGVSEKVMAYNTQGACVAAQGAWIPESPELKHTDGTIASPYHAAYCMDTKAGSDLSSVRLACQSTTNVALGTIILADNTNLTYFTNTTATATAGGTCN
jgi:type IV secretion system protein VirB2